MPRSLMGFLMAGLLAGAAFAERPSRTPSKESGFEQYAQRNGQR